MAEQEVKGEIVPAEVRKSASMILDINEAKAWYGAFNEFKEAVIESNPNFTALMNVRGKEKRLINRSGWRAIAQAFKLNDRIIEEKLINHPDGKNFSVIIRGEVFHVASGRSVEAIGGASTDEAGKGWSPTYHNVYAIAHTRMKNRGISDIVGSGEPSSDEFTEEHAPVEKPMSQAELEAREKAKNMGKPQVPTEDEKKLPFVCMQCRTRFASPGEFDQHRKEAHG